MSGLVDADALFAAEWTLAEDARTAAARETLEETGVRVALADLIGPVFRRTATFTFLGRPCRQREVTFVAAVHDSSVSTSAWTEVERATLDGLDWWTLDELRAPQEVVYPADLADLVELVLAGGWDGTTVDVGDATEAE